MDIVLAPEAAEFLRRRGGHLTLFESRINGCCGVGAGSVPMFALNEPGRGAEQYLQRPLDGVTVHLDRWLAADQGTLRISLTGRLWKTLSVTRDGESW